MTPQILFIIVLIVGIVCMLVGKKQEGKKRVIPVLIGIACCIFSLFGLITSFL